jgi:hypothetical protein
MSTATVTGQVSNTPEGMLHSQEQFEAMFDHAPKVDLRTPADVRAQAEREGWK